MSLRAFHLAFVAVFITLSALVVAWGMREFSVSASAEALSLSLMFLVAGVLPVGYAARAFRRLGELS